METVKIAIMGFGTIGSGIAEVLEKQRNVIISRTGRVYEVTKILDIRDFSLHPMKDRFTKNIEDILNDDSISVVAESIGGTKPAFEFVMSCIKAGKHVVSSNKELVATKGVEILKAAQEAGVGFLFEASVGGTLPLISSITGILQANSISKIDGILNGTTNYILTNIEKKKISFEHALERAQDLGYAETPDPSADIDGHDAARKIAILASLLYGYHMPVSRVATEGIRGVSSFDLELAQNLNGTIKLIASCYGDNYGQARVSVRPAYIFKTHRLASVDDVNNMVLLDCNMSGIVSVYGRGAGKLPTAAVMVGDIIELTQRSDFSQLLWDSELVLDADRQEQPLRYFVTVYSDNKKLITKLVEQVDAGSITDNSAAFFTSRIMRSEAEKLKKKLETYNVTVKLYEVVEE
ncbi:MAG: homoserine dehydrogenase [Oscillospiraceae bacterium]|nr:homoserine dehydrogenase [Oscillospiraceae bacterium]